MLFKTCKKYLKKIIINYKSKVRKKISDVIQQYLCSVYFKASGKKQIVQININLENITCRNIKY